MQDYEAGSGRKIQLKEIYYESRRAIKLVFSDGSESPIFGDQSVEFSDSNQMSRFNDEIHRTINYFDQEGQIAAPGTHEFIGLQGYISKSGELSHLAFVTWVSPTETKYFD